MSNISAYIILVMAVALGTAANGFAKSAQGFTVLIPSIITAITIVLCMYTLSLVMKAIPVGITYASFAGLCIVGTDRTLSTGDVANKIGTYLKALAAHDNKVPFYVALPSSTIDWDIKDFKDIPIEERNSEELSHVEGLDENNNVKKVLIYPKKSKVKNLAFDVTPAKYVTGLITEKGVCEASTDGLKKLFK